MEVVVSCPISRSRPVMRALALIFDYFRNPATQQPEQEPVDAYPAFREVLQDERSHADGHTAATS